MQAAIVVHGGAGVERPDEMAPRREGVERAARAGWEVLARGGAALDAVLAAVVVLEDDPWFNAGLGSVLTACGTVETDASVMCGSDLSAGAVGAVRGVANAVLLADAVRREGREVLLVGETALELARRHALRLCAPDDLVTARARERWRARIAAPGDTVGAVARDGSGSLAAATSTGGLAGKRAGRIGDSAVIGAGTYADDRLGAGSATGNGEAIIRAVLVRRALEHLSQGAAADDAARRALDEMRERTGHTGGLILVDPAGRIGAAHTTPAMATARRSGDGPPALS
ncbi:MAG: isoaspartyl peptidase/L-asparaginase [Thermodesulfobacteriota bacterium]